MGQPTFSVIIPVYNHVRYVAETIRSVIGQTRDDWELIVVDDGSTDGSAEIIDDLECTDDRITCIHQSNAGPASARNAALARSRCEWLAYIDSDDVWYPETLQRYGDYIAAHPHVQFIHGFRHRLNSDGSIDELPGEFQDRPTGTAELFGRMYLSHLCVCYRRSLLDEAGPYDEGLRSCEDYELYLRISMHCRFEPLGLPTGLRRRHATNLSRQTGYSRMLEAEVLRRFVERQGGRDVLSEERINARLGRLYYASGRQYFKARCFAQALTAVEHARRRRKTFKSLAIRCLAGCLLPFGTSDGREMPRLRCE